MFAVSLIKSGTGTNLHLVLVNARVVKILLKRRCRRISSVDEYNGKGGIGTLEAGYIVGFCAMSLLNGLTVTGGSFGLPGHSGRKW